jgi:O-antigen ligase
MALACAAVALPTLLAFNVPPSATYLNQALALLGWGAWLFQIASTAPGVESRWHDASRALWIALGILLGAALSSPLRTGLPWALAWSSAALIGAAALAAALGARTGRAGHDVTQFRALCVSLVLAGLLSSAIGIIQVFSPHWADGDLIARTSVAGRAVGNLRQPNHLCSLLLWSIVAVLWLAETRVLTRSASAVGAMVMMIAVVLSGSRSGVLGASLLALWGLLDKRLTQPTRVALLLAPLVYGLVWYGASAWSEQGHALFGAAGRFGPGGDISSSRFGIWSNTLALIRSHPWAGVGFGEFNFAWSLSEFPDRPVAFFDHAHNLPLQLAVELGLPLAGVVLVLLGWALWCAARRCMRPSDLEGAAALPQRPAFVMVLLVLLHSLLEYPLWYAYFLLPAAFVFGLCLGDSAWRGLQVPEPPSVPYRRTGLRLASLLLLVGAAASIHDYLRVVVIFAPPDSAAPLEQRIAAGQRSWFFSHHADYAAATTQADDPVAALEAANRAAHFLLDTRLMTAWANALHANGDDDRAQYIAQRLREFRSPQSEPFFAPCREPQTSDDTPFQCHAPQRRYTYADFR